MNNQGYIKLWRKIKDKSFYKSPNICHLAIHILLSCNHKENKFLWNDEEITLKEGQILTGRNKLAIEIGLTPQKVRSGLKLLKKLQFLTIRSTNQYSIITICKYNLYQKLTKRDNQQTVQRITSGQPTYNQRATTNKNDKKDKNEKKVTKEAFDFTSIWLRYPKQTGRKEAVRHFNASVKTEEDYTNIQKAMDIYCKHVKLNIKDPKFIMSGATWFNNWEDWVVNPIPEAPKVYSSG